MMNQLKELAINQRGEAVKREDMKAWKMIIHKATDEERLKTQKRDPIIRESQRMKI